MVKIDVVWSRNFYIGIFGMICWIGFMSYGHFPHSSFSWCAQGPHIFWWPHGTMNTSGSLSMQMSHVTVLSSCGCVGGCSRISSSLESWYSSGVTASSLESSESVLFSRVSHSSAAHSSKYLSFETLKEYVTALKNSRELYSSFSSFSSAFWSLLALITFFLAWRNYSKSRESLQVGKNSTSIFLIYFAFRAIVRGKFFFEKTFYQGSPLWILVL